MLISNFFRLQTGGFKNAAYCAIFIVLTGCSATTSSINNADVNDALNADKVRARANAIPNMTVAQAQEKDALARQAAADRTIANIESDCMPKFLVTKCIEDARNARNDAWDAAQVDLTAARLFIRTTEANQRRTELQQKLADYNAEEKANIPVRAANKAAFDAKQTAFAQRQAQYAAEQIAQAPERAANVSAFEERRTKILELQKKREDEAKKRAEEAAAKKP